MNRDIKPVDKLPQKTLGMFIKERRLELNKSLRGFAHELSTFCDKNTPISAGFLSDIENGRRFPSEKMFTALAQALKVDRNELNQYDQRIPTDKLQDLVTLNPLYGFAFKRAVEFIQESEISPQELINRLVEPIPDDNNHDPSP